MLGIRVGFWKEIFLRWRIEALINDFTNKTNDHTLYVLLQNNFLQLKEKNPPHPRISNENFFFATIWFH